MEIFFKLQLIKSNETIIELREALCQQNQIA